MHHKSLFLELMCIDHSTPAVSPALWPLTHFCWNERCQTTLSAETDRQIFLNLFTTKPGTRSGSCRSPQQGQGKECCQRGILNQEVTNPITLPYPRAARREVQANNTFFFLWLICTLWKLGVTRREERETYSGLTTISASKKLKKSFWNASELLKNKVKERSEMKSQLNRKEAKREFGKCQQKVLAFFSPGVFVLKQSGQITEESWLALVLANLNFVQKQTKCIKMSPRAVHMLGNQFPLSTSNTIAMAL